MKQYGIPEFQRAWYVKGKSEQAFNNITPQWYEDLRWNIQRYYRFKKNKWRDPYELLRYSVWEILENGATSKKEIFYRIPKRDDAWRLYLGMPQKNNSFGISEYQPSQSNEHTKVYFKPNYWTIEMKQALLDRYLNEIEYAKIKQKEVFKDQKIISNERIRVFDPKRDSLKQQNIPRSDAQTAERLLDNPLWDFTVWKREDEKWMYLYIYDIWDLQPFKIGEWASYSDATKENIEPQIEKLREKWYDVDENTEISTIFGAGMPFEIYDRIYYDPTTKKIIP